MMSNGLKRIKNRGIKLYRLSILMLILSIITAGILFYSMTMTSKINDETAELTVQLGKYRSDAFELQIASDYLTDRIRTFVLTGEKKYLDDYFEEVNVTKRRERAIDELEKNREGLPSVENLKAAMDNSVALQDLEYYAARLTVEANHEAVSKYPEEIRKVELSKADKNKTSSEKKTAAIEAAFGKEYHEAKDAISVHMNDCLAGISEELSKEQETISEKLKTQVFTEHLLTIILSIFMFILVAIILKLVVFPLKDSVKLIRKEKTLPLKGAYEVRFLAKTYNLMHNTSVKSFEKLTFEATHDELTGLYNRRGYDFLLENIDIETCALLLVDLDEFKQINDTYGHEVGDRILKEVSDILHSSFRNRDYICRFGGDEMAVIMVHADPSMKPLIENKIMDVNSELQANDRDLPAISISVGVAFGREGISLETLFKKADDALYRVKENGRCGVEFG